MLGGLGFIQQLNLYWTMLFQHSLELFFNGNISTASMAQFLPCSLMLWRGFLRPVRLFKHSWQALAFSANVNVVNSLIVLYMVGFFMCLRKWIGWRYCGSGLAGVIVEVILKGSNTEGFHSHN